MDYKSVLVWMVILVLISPFVAYGLSQYIPIYDSFIVTSGSMEPEIETGALLFTRPIKGEEVKVGDTITFERNEEYTTHKVIQKNDSNGALSFLTQGVANNSPDPGEVSQDDIIGVKIFSLPFLGYAIAWAGTTTGFILFLVIPGFLIIFLEIRKLYAEYKTNRKA